MALLCIRTMLLYFLTLIALKAMGKRQLGQLQPFELVVVLVISEMASLAMQSNTTPIAYSIVPIVTLTLLQILLALLNLKSEKLRDLICGKPAMLIERGRLRERELARLRLNLNDMQELCRAQGYFDLSAIEYAIMETNGSLSILPRTEKRPLQVSDILADAPQEQLSQLIILDGHVNQHALHALGRNQAWLNAQLKQYGCNSPAQLFLAGLDDSGNFFAQKKQPPRTGG